MRNKARDHPSADILRVVQARYSPAYDDAQASVQRVVARFMGKPLAAHGNGGRTRGGGAGRTSMESAENNAARKKRLHAMFTGNTWTSAAMKAANLLHDANRAAIDAINDALPDAYAEGANRAAYTLSRSADYSPAPYTAAVVLALASAGLLSLPRRELNRPRDTAWLLRRLQSIVASAILLETPEDDMPAYIARAYTGNAFQSMGVTARVAISGAWDAGAYRAGLDAEADGLAVEKTWLSIMDLHVRDSHADLHRTTLPIRTLFQGHADTLRYPHDPDADPAETYRCRCRMAVHLAGRAPGPYSDAELHADLLPTQVYAYRKWRDESIRKAGTELLQAHWRRLHAKDI